MLEIPFVVFDEAGNTGQNLLDPSQPVFVLASVYLPEDEAKALSTYKGAAEVHFKNLKKSREGREHILHVLQSPILTKATVKVFAIHKPYMITTKIVDMLVEELAHRDGVNFYERGQNIAFANLLETTTPILCGEANFRDLKESFVRMIRTKERADTAAFYKSVNRLYRASKLEDSKSFIATVAMTLEVIAEVLPNASITALDPAVPAFLTLCGAWDEQLDCPFGILHDDSKAIAFDQRLLERFMDPGAVDQEIVGPDRRQMRLPVRATGISFVDSKTTARVQVADVVSSAFAHWFRSNLSGTRDDLSRSLDEETPMKDWLIGGIWPSADVDPTDLETDQGPTVNLADQVADFLARQAKKPQ